MKASELVQALQACIALSGDHEIRFPCILFGSRKISAVKFDPPPESPERKAKAPPPQSREPRFMICEDLPEPSKGVRT